LNKNKNNSAGKLAGMVVAIKDVLAYKDHPLTCSSNILKILLLFTQQQQYKN